MSATELGAGKIKAWPQPALVTARRTNLKPEHWTDCDSVDNEVKCVTMWVQLSVFTLMQDNAFD